MNTIYPPRRVELTPDMVLFRRDVLFALMSSNPRLSKSRYYREKAQSASADAIHRTATVHRRSGPHCLPCRSSRYRPCA